MVAAIDVSVRELRNHTKQVIERVEDGTTMFLTKNGERIATITPLRPATWADLVDQVLAGPRYESHLGELLAEDEVQLAELDHEHISPR